jgi:hypothetical protein
MDSATGRLRPRLSRTFSRSRWSEYGRFLESAMGAGYEPVPLERWVRREGPQDARVLIMRHDVDQHPRSALAMARIEEDLGIRSSWYFRWRTAHPAIVNDLEGRGFEIGLHYETLTRLALERGLEGAPSEELIAEGRELLRAEIEAFARLFGPIRSVVPHGDTRIPAVRNSELLRRQDLTGYGIEFDGNEAMRGRGIAHWLTDRTVAEGRWRDGLDPAELFASGDSPILSVTHPNNWASGPGLWLDRVMRSALPRPSGGFAPAAGRPIHTGPDRPPA